MKLEISYPSHKQRSGQQLNIRTTVFKVDFRQSFAAGEGGEKPNCAC